MRDAGEPDRGFLLQLFRGVKAQQWRLPAQAIATMQPLLDMQFHAQERAYWTAHPHSRCEVILESGRPVGRLWVDRMDDGVRILDISVDPAHQGRGIGGAVIDALLNEAHAVSLPVSLTVAQDNPAVNLYRRLGFAVIAEAPPYLEMRWHSDASEMLTGALHEQA